MKDALAQESDAPSDGDRARAVRLRGRVKVKAPLTPEEAAWLEDYERQRDAVRQSRGGSRSHKVSYTEESAEAVGTGSAAEVAAAAAMSREEGRRYDHLLNGVIRGMESAVMMFEKLSALCMTRMTEDARTIRELTRSDRENYLDKTELEAEAIRRDAEGGGDAVSKLAEQLLPQLLPMLMNAGMNTPKKT